MTSYLFYSSFALYLTAGILYLLQLVFSRDALAKFGLRLTLLAWVLQTALLALVFARVGYPFITDSFASYSFTAWVSAAVFLLLNLRYRFQVAGVVVLPMISTFFLLAHFSKQNYGASGLMNSPWGSVHIVLSFLALAIFSLSFVLGILFIIEEFQLKHKVLPKVFLRLPNLEILETIHTRSLWVGLILLSGAIITGAGWAKSVTGVYFFEDARQLWAICAWLIYALILQARLAGWRGRRGILLSVLGFVVILFTFLGVEHR
jgi:ABC-type uncharacterized transport system, permease component